MFFENSSFTYAWIIYNASILIIIGLLSKSETVKRILKEFILSPRLSYFLIPIGIINLFLFFNEELQVLLSYKLEDYWSGFGLITSNLIYNLTMYALMLIFLIDATLEFYSDKKMAIWLSFRIILLFKYIEFVSEYLYKLTYFSHNTNNSTIVIFLAILLFSLLISFKLSSDKQYKGFSINDEQTSILLFLTLSEVMITKVLIIFYVIKYSIKRLNNKTLNKVQFEEYNFPSLKIKQQYVSLLLASLIPIFVFYLVYGKISLGINYLTMISFYYTIPIFVILLIPKLKLLNKYTLYFCYVLSLIGFFGVLIWIQSLNDGVLSIFRMMLSTNHVSNTIILAFILLWVYVIIHMNYFFYIKRKGHKALRKKDKNILGIGFSITFGLILFITIISNESIPNNGFNYLLIFVLMITCFILFRII